MFTQKDWNELSDHLSDTVNWAPRTLELVQAALAEKEAELAKLRAELDRVLGEAVDAIQLLHDHQNGCPLPSYEEGWNEAMHKAKTFLASPLVESWQAWQGEGMTKRRCIHGHKVTRLYELALEPFHWFCRMCKKTYADEELMPGKEPKP